MAGGGERRGENENAPAAEDQHAALPGVGQDAEGGLDQAADDAGDTDEKTDLGLG